MTSLNAGLRVRGRSFLAFVLAPEAPLATWLNGLDEQIGRAASFFDGKPVVLDLSALAEEEPGLPTLMAELQARSVRIIAVEGTERSWPGMDGLVPRLQGGRSAGLVALPDRDVGEPPEAAKGDAAADGAAQTPATEAASDDEAADAAPEPIAPPEPIIVTVSKPGLLLDRPVRSGQSVLFPDGDVTVVGSVASGAEIVAGGSIHVYGTLRGRAIAGVAGHAGARIFCRRLEAELLAIDGLYLTAEAMPTGVRGKAVQARLNGDAILVTALDDAGAALPAGPVRR